MAKKARRKLAGPIRNIGFLLATTPEDWDQYIEWFEAALKPDIRVAYLPPEGARGDPQAIAEAAADLAKYYKVIVTASTQAALALKTATATTNAQFVYASVGDPATSGLERTPGGKYTGGSNKQVELVQRRVDYMLSKPNVFKEKFAVLGDATEPAHKKAMDDVFDYLHNTKGKDARKDSITATTNIVSLLNTLQQDQVKTLYVCSDLNLTVKSKMLNQEAHQRNMKTMFEFSEHKGKHGGDDFDGESWQPLFGKAAEYVDKILRGTKAGDLGMFSTRAKKRPSPGKKKPKKKKR